jgi:peptidoglycan/LPS O-acetylase OafA/YrhL
LGAERNQRLMLEFILGYLLGRSNRSRAPDPPLFSHPWTWLVGGLIILALAIMIGTVGFMPLAFLFGLAALLLFWIAYVALTRSSQDPKPPGE